LIPNAVGVILILNMARHTGPRPARLIDLPDLDHRSMSPNDRTEICSMIRKWMGFALSAGLLVSLGAGVTLSRADDEESELEKVMENVQKHNAAIVKGIRNVANFKKYQKDVEKSAKELVKLAKKAKPMKDALKNAKDEKDPQSKWNEIMDQLVTTTEKFEKVVAKSGTTVQQAKDAFKPVTKSCTECHQVFRVDEEKF
jgi:cytochrome c556